ncbi:MAG: hypothetical protein APR62_09290 [Smithella sp. SDB]|nr:MAG: hypothetical protein APR62_09290 [Smithella sp. SDB]
MREFKIEFIDNKALLTASGKMCGTTEDVINSSLFAEVLNRYIDNLSEHHSMLLNIFGEDGKCFFKRTTNIFADIQKGKKNVDDITAKRIISPQQREMLISVLSYLCKIKIDEVSKILPEAKTITSTPGLLFQFVQGLYDYWRRFDRFLLLANDENSLKPRFVIQENVESFTVTIRNTYRDIKENLFINSPKIFRQVRAGAEITAITSNNLDLPLPGKYFKLAEVPFINNVILAPPLILNPPMNKRKGNFVRVENNPVESAEIIPSEWLCYPAKAGEVLIYVYIHKKFIDLGLSLCNLFELADKEELKRKPDAIFLYGITKGALTGTDGMRTVFYEDNEENILTGGVPGGDEYGYFGYLKKMMLTLHNVLMMKKGRLPFHGAFVKIMLKGGKSANVLMIGDSGAGKSETIEAFKTIGDEYIQDLIIIADDMGSLHINEQGEIIGYGTEIGAFLRIDDLGPGYAFGQLDAAIIMSANQSNARLIIPVTPYATIIQGHPVDYVLYANNYEEEGDAIERFASTDEALNVFRSGKVMSKGTTTATGIINSYFANIFGPPQYKELHEKIASDFFTTFFRKGIFVGQMRTRLGIKGFERKGPQETARALLETILKT